MKAVLVDEDGIGDFGADFLDVHRESLNVANPIGEAMSGKQVTKTSDLGLAFNCVGPRARRFVFYFNAHQWFV